MYAAQLQCSDASCLAIFDACGALDALFAETCPYCHAQLELVPSWEPESIEAPVDHGVTLQVVQSPLSGDRSSLH